ncbi:hypothetical protein HanRHA438_Chr05g0239321 [Helianthus annuus]|nr:hypothetical protein HanRHA438_Chr05g0239321 [Helianthus annuus]
MIKSWVAAARTSEHETTPGHSISSAILTRVTMSKPSPASDSLMSWSRSALL